MSLYFIHIGMMKSATSWLYNNYYLKHKKLATILIKEFHHLSDTSKTKEIRLLKKIKTKFPYADPLEVKKYYDYLLNGSTTNYFKIFDYYKKPGYDSSPIYSSYNEEKILELKKIWPQEIKIILTIRNPINRAWSHYNHYLRGLIKQKKKVNKITISQILQMSKEKSLSTFLEREGFKERAFPSKIISNWEKHFKNIYIDHYENMIESNDNFINNLNLFLFNENYDYSENFPLKKRFIPTKIPMDAMSQDMLKKFFIKELATLKNIFPKIYK